MKKTLTVLPLSKLPELKKWEKEINTFFGASLIGMSFPRNEENSRIDNAGTISTLSDLSGYFPDSDKHQIAVKELLEAIQANKNIYYYSGEA
jgi:hypothetical protein